MRISCPYCGSRDIHEFVHRGDASPKRPDTNTASVDEVYDYLYLRDNPAGILSEHWYHAQGCRNWLVVARDTRTHLIERVAFAQREA